MKRLGKAIYLIMSVLTAMIGYDIHGNVFYTILDFLFWPIAIIWWILSHDLTMTVLRETFSFFFK